MLNYSIKNLPNFILEDAEKGIKYTYRVLKVAKGKWDTLLVKNGEVFVRHFSSQEEANIYLLEQVKMDYDKGE